MTDKRTKMICIGGGLLLLFLGPLFVGNYYLHLALLTFIYIILTSSLRTIYISGQMSLGHASFMAIGAYTSAILAKNLHLTPWITIPMGGGWRRRSSEPESVFLSPGFAPSTSPWPVSFSESW